MLGDSIESTFISTLHILRPMYVDSTRIYLHVHVFVLAFIACD